MGMNCTVTMPSEGHSDIRSVTRNDLCHADFQFATPFVLELEQGELYAEKIVRLMPGKRMVVFGVWRGVEVVAKLFFDKKNSERHFKADLAGIKSMQEYKIPTPALCYSGKDAENNIDVILLEKINHTQDLEALWFNHGAVETTVPLLHLLMIEIATQHVLGVRQQDLHLGNFLFARNVIYTLDGAQIEIQKNMLQRQESIENVALLLSQLGAGVETLQISLFLHYAKARGWLVKPADMTEIKFQIRKCDVQRWQHYQKKIFRDSTDFIKIHRFGMQGAARRDCMGADLKAFMQDPDSVFARTDAVMLKNGRSSTVIKIQMDGRDVVVKRYNLKNAFHRMRRLFRQTRAAHSWRLAHKLKLFNLNTPLPIAYLETNWFGMRGKSYYLAEFVAGTDVKEFLIPYAAQLYEVASVIKNVCTLLAALESIEVTHGDLKATNIIIDASQQPYLIDLDGAAEHFSAAGLKRAAQEEKQRFLRNFADYPEISNVVSRLLK